MAQRACRQCKAIFDSGSKCPSCGNEEISESFKGKVIVVNPENSEVAKNMGINKKGVYAIKLG